MRRMTLALAVACCLAGAHAVAGDILSLRKPSLESVNAEMKGRLVDMTRNHGVDRRFWSPSLQTKRDMYVYVPPGYDGVKQYPVIVWLHGFSQDEEFFLKLAPKFDKAVVEGRLPPVVVAVPDGTFKGKSSLTNSGSFFSNNKQGNYEDYLVCDVMTVLSDCFRIRPEREAHYLAGASMGGTAAFTISIRHWDQFGGAIGIMPLLDLRYQDCKGRHFGPFDPDCLGRIERYRPLQKAGTLLGVITIRYGSAMRPLFGGRRSVKDNIQSINPADLIQKSDVPPGALNWFLAYGTNDQFNGDAENKAFLHFAGMKGHTAEVFTVPDGRHNRQTAYKTFQPFCEWMTPLLQPYVPQ